MLICGSQVGTLGIIGKQSFVVRLSRVGLLQLVFRTIVLPAELSAAAVIASVYVSKGVANYSGIVQKLNLGVTSVLVSDELS